MPVGAQTAQIVVQSAYIGGNGHLVVIQNDDDILLLIADVIERFQGHTSG